MESSFGKLGFVVHSNGEKPVDDLTH